MHRTTETQCKRVRVINTLWCLDQHCVYVSNCCNTWIMCCPCLVSYMMYEHMKACDDNYLITTLRTLSCTVHVHVNAQVSLTHRTHGYCDVNSRSGASRGWMHLLNQTKRWKNLSTNSLPGLCRSFYYRLWSPESLLGKFRS